MGAAVTTSNPSDFANRIQTYFNPKLLEALQFNLVMASYGMRQAFPAIGTSIRFFRPRPADSSYVTNPTTEGTTPTNLTEVAVGYVDVPLTQKAGLATITDITQAIDLVNTVQLYTKTMGADAALHLDDICRNAVVTGLNDSDAKFGTGNYFERFAGTTNTGTSSTDFATFNALSTSNGKITRAEHLKCVTQLKSAKVPMIGGKYVAATPPQIIHDIRQDTTWTAAATYSDPEKLYKGMQIMLDGCAFVEQTNPWREGATYKTYSATGANYGTIYLGEGAFGCPELTNTRAGGSPMSPKLVVLAQPDKYDPLNLQTTIGWKAFYGAKLLVATTNGTTPASWERPRALLLRSKSTFA